MEKFDAEFVLQLLYTKRYCRLTDKQLLCRARDTAILAYGLKIPHLQKFHSIPLYVIYRRFDDGGIVIYYGNYNKNLWKKQAFS